MSTMNTMMNTMNMMGNMLMIRYARTVMETRTLRLSKSFSSYIWISTCFVAGWYDTKGLNKFSQHDMFSTSSFLLLMYDIHHLYMNIWFVSLLRHKNNFRVSACLCVNQSIYLPCQALEVSFTPKSASSSSLRSFSASATSVSIFTKLSFARFSK